MNSSKCRWHFGQGTDTTKDLNQSSSPSMSRSIKARACNSRHLMGPQTDFGIHSVVYWGIAFAMVEFYRMIQVRTNLPDCVLRPLAWTDLSALCLHANNPKVWSHADTSRRFTSQDAVRWIDANIEVEPSLNLAITYNGEVIGCIGVEPQKDAERYTGILCYWIGEKFWGQGIGTASVRAFTPYVFDKLNLVRIEARVLENNLASMMVLEKSGYINEGVHSKAVFKDDSFKDRYIFARVQL